MNKRIRLDIDWDDKEFFFAPDPNGSLVYYTDYKQLESELAQVKELAAKGEAKVSFQDFKWACGHVGPAVCQQCWERLKVERDEVVRHNRMLVNSILKSEVGKDLMKRLDSSVEELKRIKTKLRKCQRNNDFHIKEWTRAEVENKRLRQERDKTLTEKQKLRDFILAIQVSTEDPVTENHCRNKLKKGDK